MLKKTSIHKLKVGMYIVDSGLSKNDYPALYSVEGRIRSQTDIQKIRDKGFLDVFIETDGQSNKVTTLKQGDFFGELALLNDEPRKATIKAVGEVKVLSLSKERFLEAVEQDSNLEGQLKRAYFHA